MEFALSLLVGLFFVASIYLILSPSLIRLLIGVALLGNAINLLIFTMGRITPEIPPILTKEMAKMTENMANALPQALILTAIVISFSFFAFLMVLVYRSYQELGTDNSQHMRLAEPKTYSHKTTLA